MFRFGEEYFFVWAIRTPSSAGIAPSRALATHDVVIYLFADFEQKYRTAFCALQNFILTARFYVEFYLKRALFVQEFCDLLWACQSDKFIEAGIAKCDMSMD